MEMTPDLEAEYRAMLSAIDGAMRYAYQRGVEAGIRIATERSADDDSPDRERDDGGRSTDHCAMR